MKEALNNSNVKKYSADTQARFGCKGRSKFWYGYKGHIRVDMSSGLIERAAVTLANISDQEGFKHICPREGQMVFLGSFCDSPNLGSDVRVVSMPLQSKFRQWGLA